jgi:hypothetical protein
MNAVVEITADHAWSGSRYIDVMNPQPEDIDPFEVATGLSREPRYGGACTTIFWSVAQHSLVCEQFARQDGIEDRDVLLAILLHDAPEYMLRDLIRPVKRNCPSYHVIESVWWAAVASRFGLPHEMPPEVKRYDDLALAAEKKGLISPRCGEWPGVPPAPGKTIPDEIHGLSMADARDYFLRRLDQLG